MPKSSDTVVREPVVLRIGVWETIPRLGNDLARQLSGADFDVSAATPPWDDELQMLLVDLDDEPAERLVLSFQQVRRQPELKLAFVASQPKALEWMLRELGAATVLSKTQPLSEISAIVRNLCRDRR